MASFPVNSGDENDDETPTHGKGDRNEYYAKWDKLAQEVVEEVDAEEKKEKEESDAKLGLATDAPVSASQVKDLTKRAQLKEAKKRWDGVESDRDKLKVNIEGLTSGSKTITVKEDLAGIKRVVYFKNNSNTTINLPSELNGQQLIKVFIENCQDCVFNVSTILVTQCVEIAHCSNVTLNVLCPIATIQVDLSEGVTLNYGQNTLSPTDKVYHSAVRRLTVNHQVAAGGALKTQTTGEMDDFELGEKDNDAMGKPADENQFVTRLDEKKNVLLTDLVLRDAGKHPTTRREIERRKKELLGAMKEKGVDPNSERGQRMLRAEDPLDSIRSAGMSKDKGNGLFKEQDYGQAMLYYSQAILDLETYARKISDSETKETSEQNKHYKTLLLSCHSNRAACALKLGQHLNALDDSNKCIELDSEHAKAFFRKGLALHALGRFREACPALGQALKLSPNNKQIKTALQFAERKAAMQGRR
jgi:tetratricopeptide (TPR) repeat protein